MSVRPYDDAVGQHLVHLDDPVVGAWIEPELTGPPGTVTALVPSRFPVFARLFHSAYAPDGTLVRWAEVASEMGQTMHSGVQWHALVGAKERTNFTDSLWKGSEPIRGKLDAATFARLCHELIRGAGSEAKCVFALWLGLEWCSVRTGESFYPDGQSDGGVSVHSNDRALLRLPPGAGRDFRLLVGPLAAATEIGECRRTGSTAPSSPTMSWAVDRSWFATSDLELNSTLIGGDAQLIERIVACSELEAWPIDAREDVSPWGE